MSDPLQNALLELQRGYLAAMPGRLAELRSDLADLIEGDGAAAGSLQARLHRLAGSGGSFGFLELSALAREAERCLADTMGSRELNRMTPLLDQLEGAVRRAEAQLAESLGA